MKKNYPNSLVGLLVLFFSFFTQNTLTAQSFDQSQLNFNVGNVANGVTSLMYGPDGRLYVAEYPGLIKILTISRVSSTNYQVDAIEVLDGIQTMADHNDDGTLFSSTARETTGLTVTGTATNPVIYVASSDFRIGAGSGGGNGDVGLDTNSGVITRFYWNGSSWDVVDIVRGLPRSEENHATNGLEVANINGTDYLIVASGGHTNAGAPSTNFVYTCEYALSGAILSINLDMLEGMPILNDNGRSYIYDLPTVDDPTRANVNGITDPDAPGYDGVDINDPWGGNDGLNQAIVDPSGPVQVYSPGYRNAYDIVLTESGALYATDNGANSGWGGFPEGEGTANVTNEYNPAEPGGTVTSGATPETIDNEDHLQLITTDIQTYVPGSLYGGHPNPIRANPAGAGLYTDDGTNQVFRTLTYDPDGSTPGSTTDPSIALPANWPPVPVANVVEGDFRGPTKDNPEGPDDNPVVVWSTNTNGIDEYTASNFSGAMQGDLLAGKNGGVVRRVQLLPDGTLETYTANFFSGLGGNPLGITCNSDNDVFPGTVWAGTLNGLIVVLEPQDFLDCIEPGEPGYVATEDGDMDGYLNQDEVDNGTQVCNGGSQPTDFDKAVGGSPLVSDLNDTDDDADGISDATDPFQLGDPTSSGSDAFTLPISNDLFNDQQGLGGIFGLGMTGLMNNGDTGNNWLDWIDQIDAGPNPNDVLGGAPGIMTSHMTDGTALGNANDQEKGYQYGVQVDNTTGRFTVVGGMNGFTGPLRLYGNTNGITNGELGFFIGDGTQSNYIKFVVTLDGFTALQEINDVPGTPITATIDVADRPSSGIRFYFVVDPATGSVDLEYEIDGGTRTVLGSITAQGSILQAIQTSGTDLAVGFIGTSNTPGQELEGSWDFLNVVDETPTLVQPFEDIQRIVDTADEDIDLDTYFDDDGGVANLTYTVEANSDPSIGASITNNILTLSYPSSATSSTITIRATDSDMLFAEDTFLVTVINGSIVLYRVNSGGPQVASIDADMDWGADTTSNNSPYLSEPGTDSSFPSDVASTDASVNTATTPFDIFDVERFDNSNSLPNMTYSFPVSQPGNYEVRLYMGNGFSGTSQPGQRIFDVSIEGVTYPLLNDIDLSGTYGHTVGTMISHIVNVNDGTLDVILIHGPTNNPLINGIEIIDVSDSETPIYVYEVATQTNEEGQQLDGSLVVQGLGGDGNLQYAATNLPPGLSIEPTNGQIGGTVDAGASAGSPYSVSVTVDDSDGDASDTVTITFDWVVNPGVGNWIDKDENEDYTARHECSFVQAGDKFYLMGGRENPTTIDVYDYTTDSWNALVDSAPFEFNHFQALEYQGLIWIIGAFVDNVFPNEVPAEHIWMFNPATMEWIQGPEIPASRRRGSGGLVLYNDKFYLVGGNNDGHDGGYVAQFDEYDPATGTWTVLADAPRARDHFAAVLIDDKLYAAGGRLSGGTGGVFKPLIPEVDVYDFIAETWSTLPAGQNIPTPRAGGSAVNFNDKLVVMGGEVFNELVYGVNINDALPITEEYDPATQTWTRLPDMNHERHGFQAIVSGPGIHVLGGSPNRGGGNQKNMEYLGADNPVGTAISMSSLSGPNTLLVNDGETVDFDLDVSGGNVALFIKSMVLSGPDAADFNIVSGELTEALLAPNTTQTLSVELTGTGADRSAVLTITYDDTSTLVVNLTNNPDTNFDVTNPGDQFNYEGDAVSLQIEATSVNATTFSATGLPPDLTINPNTGLITGTIDDGLIPGGGDGNFLEENGLVVIETESGDTSGWNITNLDGETGIIANTVSLASQNGTTIPYDITITTPGVYRFNWKSFFSGPAPADENDSWLRFPNNDDVWFFGIDASEVSPASEAEIIARLQGDQAEVVFPKGSSRVTAATEPEGAGGNGYFKVYRSGGQSEVYDWQARTSDFNNHSIYVWFVNAGTYVMEISERSAGHAIDRVALAKVDTYGYDPSDTFLDGLPESQGGSSSGPGAADNSPYNVSVTVTDDGTPPGNETVDFVWYIGQPGELIAVPEADVTEGIIPLTVNFTGSNSLDDVGVTSYLWDFKDGTTSTEADPTHIFMTPGVYDVDLTVGDASGNSDTKSITITVNGTGVPPVAVASSNITEGDVPLEVIFDASGSTDDVMIVSYAWDFIDGGTSTEINPTYTFATAGTYNVALTVTDVEGLTDTDMITITVNVPNQAPVAIASATPELGDAPLEVTFTGSTSTDDVAVVTYAWDFGDGGTSDQADPVYTYNTPGSYDAVLTVTDGEGLTDMATITITVNTPNAPPVALAEATPESGLVPLEVTFTGSNSTDDVGIVSYSWDFGDGGTSDEADPVYTYTTAGSFDAVLTVTDGGGLSDTSTVNIVVSEPDNEPPVALATANPTEGTAPLPVIFDASGSTDDKGIVSYFWDFKDGTTSSEMNPVTTFDTAGTYVVELTVTDEEGLTDTTTITITVSSANEGPVAVAAADPLSGDAPLEVQFTGSNSTDDVAVTSYAWDFGDGNTSSEANPVYTFTVVGTYEVSLTVSDGEGLEDTATLTIVVNDPVTNDAPVAVAIATPLSGDAPLEVSFDGSGSSDDVAITSYNWDFGDGSSSTEINPTNTFTQVGTYTVVLTVMDEEGLMGTDSVVITVTEPVSNTPPVAEVSATPLTGTVPLEVSFIGSGSSDDKGIVSYSWDFGNGETASVADPTYTFEFAGTFDVVLTVQDEEGETDTATITIEVQENEPQGGTEIEIVLAPNPASGFANLNVLEMPTGTVVTEIQLYDSTGRLIGTFDPQDNGIFADSMYSIPVGTLRDELYYVKIEFNQGDPLTLSLLVSNR